MALWDTQWVLGFGTGCGRGSLFVGKGLGGWYGRVEWSGMGGMVVLFYGYEIVCLWWREVDLSFEGFASCKSDLKENDVFFAKK